MQGTPSIDVAILGVPGLLVGLLFGYTFGGMSSLSLNYRIGLGIITSFFGGLITGLLFMSQPLSSYIPFLIGPFEVILMILSYLGGYVLGAISNWAPLPEPSLKRHIIYEPDDDEEFDREIEEVLGGKANNS